jgi:anti-sigma factor RsiW
MSTSHPAELQLLDYVEGSLTGEELRGLRRHVTTCSACQETLRELSHAVDVLERLPTVGIPHDGMRRSVARNRRKLWMRAVPIFAIVLAAGAIVQELRPTSTESSAARTAAAAAAAAAQRPALSYTSVVAHVPATGSDRAGVASALAGFNPYIPSDRGSLVALVDFDDLTAARQSLEHSTGTQQVTVLLVGVEGLNGGVQRETLRPVTPISPTR